METVMFIEIGMGTDLHGQDITKACVRAVENAIRFNSMPGLRTVLPGGDLQNMKVHVTLGVPAKVDEVDIERVKAVFPYGHVTIDITSGGMLTTSGVILPDKGDLNDDLYVVVAAVKAGY